MFCGMIGTAASSVAEIKSMYDLEHSSSKFLEKSVYNSPIRHTIKLVGIKTRS